MVADLPPTIDAFPRASGPPGVRNHLLVLSACGLNASGARKIAARLPGAKLISTLHGRGQVGADRALHDALLTGFGCHPNVGAVLLLAADDAMGARLSRPIAAAGRPCPSFSLQAFEEDGERLVDAAVEAGRALQRELAEAARVPVPIDRLTVAMECGHSDASSGIVANPLVGRFADALIAAGGRVVISETLEWTGTEPILRARAANPAIADRLVAMIEARHRTAAEAGLDIYLGNPGPQNHAGGLTTLEEKSLGAIMKGGATPIVGALEHGARIPDAPGLYLMDTPTLSPESISAMVAGGAQIVLFTTGQGNPYGSALAPTVKITANPQTATRLPRQIDVDASAAFEGRAALDAVDAVLARQVIAVAEGAETWAERMDEGEEALSRLLPSI